jgi:hypothetical protein
MKTLITAPRRKSKMIMMMIAAMLMAFASMAQLPDCSSGSIVYGLFSPNNPPSGSDSTEIRTISTATGAIGALIGSRRYYITKDDGTGTISYGSAALGVDAVTNRFYMMTQMVGSPSPKDIITINPVAPTATGIVIASTPAALDNYHFVKMAVSPSGIGYAIGVHRDSSTAAATFNPLIRFSTCGALPVANCANGTVLTLGYLPNTPASYKQHVYNGDIAFDWNGNLYFLSASFEKVGTKSKYTNARLFRIKAADIPSVAGVGVIPMTFLADYTILDSTGVSGIALDNTGKMYLSVKRFTNNDPTAAYVSQFYSSPSYGSATLMAGFAPIPANTAISDLASCNFPTGVLSSLKLELSSRYSNGSVSLKWEVDNDDRVLYYELQRGNDENEFETIAKIYPRNTQAMQSYSYTDGQTGSGTKFYRVREIIKNGNFRFYSNVSKINFTTKVSIIGRPKPNPFVNNFDFNIQLRSANNINLRLCDQSSRVVYQKRIAGQSGSNNVSIGGLSALKPGIYMIEITVDNEVVREKLIKQ